MQMRLKAVQHSRTPGGAPEIINNTFRKEYWNYVDFPHTQSVLSRASEMGSPTNPPWAPGSDKTQGQGSFGPFTGALAITTYKNLKKETNHTFDSLFTKTGWAWHVTINIYRKTSKWQQSNLRVMSGDRGLLGQMPLKYTISLPR